MSNKQQEEIRNDASDEMTLDDAARVKVLSPARLVFKRFIRNKLAIFGTAVLVLLFIFCFLGPVFYPYGETEVFYGWREQNGDYAYAKFRTEYVTFWNPECDSSFQGSLSSVEYQVNSVIKKMAKAENEEDSLRHRIAASNGAYYQLVKLSNDIYALTDSGYTCVADYVGTSKGGTATFREGYEPLDSAFSQAAADAIGNGGSFEFEGKKYDIVKDSTGGKLEYDIYCDIALEGDPYYYFVSSVLTPTFYAEGDFQAYGKDSGFKFHAFLSHATGTAEYTYDNASYRLAVEEDIPVLYKNDQKCAFLSDFVASKKGGAGALNIEFLYALEAVVGDMNEKGFPIGAVKAFTAVTPKLENGKEVLDENGNKVMQEAEFTVKREQNDYTVWREDSTYVITTYETPSSKHLLGTDAHGMDVLARIMYGGRISLMVGFVVVFLEMFLGVIMGGIAGYFGGWVDNIIMRLVDVFYCIPSMPILIITGALFDALKMNHILRLVWMMAILGFLGWAGVARLVRGQILSLREQEFMVAAEASGLSTKRRIFRHLVPNVMPQLIVQATMGLGSVIITESTLSFLGLGVKHPLATWGNMMNNITEKLESLTAYAYIWIPVGCLICFAVIAFNFVGDGLRDAFDPKMKR